MAGKKKTTLSQRVVGIATIGMPSPVRTVLKKRYVAALLILLLPALLASGALTISWQQGFPKVAVHPEKFAAAKTAIFAKIQQVRGAPAAGGPVAPGFPPVASRPASGQPGGWPQPQQRFTQQPAGYPQAGQAVAPGWNNTTPTPQSPWGAAPPQPTQPQPPRQQQAANPWGQPSTPDRGHW